MPRMICPACFFGMDDANGGFCLSSIGCQIALRLGLFLLEDLSVFTLEICFKKLETNPNLTLGTIASFSSSHYMRRTRLSRQYVYKVLILSDESIYLVVLG
jgi:hypothetical protein